MSTLQFQLSAVNSASADLSALHFLLTQHRALTMDEAAAIRGGFRSVGPPMLIGEGMRIETPTEVLGRIISRMDWHIAKLGNSSNSSTRSPKLRQGARKAELRRRGR